MEFRYRAGEERDSSTSSSNGYFADQALRAGISIGSSGLVPLMTSRTEALLEELRKERIKEELLVREIAHERMLEEDIRRELELKRRFSLRRFEEERFLPLEMEARFGDRLGSGFAPVYPEAREAERSPSLVMPQFRDIGMDERSVPLYRDVGGFERPHVLQKADVGKMGLSKLLSKSEVLSSKDHKPDHQVSGVKRKAASELPQLTKKEWSCSLCHVTATSEETLNKHLQGKKHKAKAALLTNNKAISKKLKAFSPMEKNGGVPLDQAKGISANEPTKQADTEGKKQQHKQSKAVRCDLCKVKCNNPAMLDCHLKGKKHQAQLKSKKSDGVGVATIPTAEVVKEVTDQKERERVVKAEDMPKQQIRREKKRESRR